MPEVYPNSSPAPIYICTRWKDSYRKKLLVKNGWKSSESNLSYSGFEQPINLAFVSMQNFYPNGKFVTQSTF